MPQSIEFLLKCPQTDQIFFIGTTGADFGIFEISKNEPD